MHAPVNISNKKFYHPRGFARNAISFHFILGILYRIISIQYFLGRESLIENVILVIL